MPCLICHTEGGRKNRLTEHHYYHPKNSKWVRRMPEVIQIVCQRCHNQYNVFFDHNCRKAGCIGSCNFRAMCCYRREM